MPDLEDSLYEKIQVLCRQGDELANQDNLKDALNVYWSAFDLLPEPATQWSAAIWILAAIGDANFFGGDYVAGRDNLALAMHCPEAIGNPFLHLRLGQCQLELGLLDQAADNLARAFLLEGKDLFEQEDPKYLKFVMSRLQEPPGGW